MRGFIVIAVMVVGLFGFLTQAATIEFTVKGMSCGACAESISKKVGELPQVKKVEVDHSTGLGKVELKDGESLSNEELAAAVKKAGRHFDLVLVSQ